MHSLGKMLICFSRLALLHGSSGQCQESSHNAGSFAGSPHSMLRTWSKQCWSHLYRSCIDLTFEAFSTSYFYDFLRLVAAPGYHHCPIFNTLESPCFMLHNLFVIRRKVLHLDVLHLMLIQKFPILFAAHCPEFNVVSGFYKFPQLKHFLVVFSALLIFSFFE